MSWFELDLTTIQDQISKSVEEASRLIDEVNNLEILNLDAMAENQEKDNAIEDSNSIYDNDDVEEIYISTENEHINTFENDDNVYKPVLKMGIRKLPTEADEPGWENNFAINEMLNNTSCDDTVTSTTTLKDELVIDIDVKSLSLSESSIIQSNFMESSQFSKCEIKDIMDNDELKPTALSDRKSLMLKQIKNENETLKSKKKKKKKNPDKGLDFWGFSQTDDEETLPVPKSQMAEKIPEAVSVLPIRLPQRVATGSLGNTMTLSFFDSLEDDVDLEDDPILRRIQANASRSSSQSTYQESVAAFSPTLASIAESLALWNSQSHGPGAVGPGLSEPEQSQQSTAAQGPSKGDRPATGHLLPYIQHAILRGGALLYSLVSAVLTVVADLLMVDKSLLSPSRRPGESRLRCVQRISAQLWEVLSGVFCLSLLTALLFILTYYKFRRYGTDAGE